jgi:hypothetical protein
MQHFLGYYNTTVGVAQKRFVNIGELFDGHGSLAFKACSQFLQRFMKRRLVDIRICVNISEQTLAMRMVSSAFVTEFKVRVVVFVAWCGEKVTKIEN